MVRKVRIAIAIVALLCAFGTVAHGASYTVYDGNPSSTYIQYFKDIVSGIPLTDDYLCYRSGQNEYTMIVGDLTYDGAQFTLTDMGTVYSITSDNSYNGYMSYNVDTIDSVSVIPFDKIVYSNLGNYPQLVDRGANYEIITALLVGIALLSAVIGRLFRPR